MTDLLKHYQDKCKAIRMYETRAETGDCKVIIHNVADDTFDVIKLHFYPLCQYIDYMDAAFKEQWKEGQDRCIRLSVHDDKESQCLRLMICEVLYGVMTPDQLSCEQRLRMLRLAIRFQYTSLIVECAEALAHQGATEAFQDLALQHELEALAGVYPSIRKLYQIAGDEMAGGLGWIDGEVQGGLVWATEDQLPYPSKALPLNPSFQEMPAVQFSFMLLSNRLRIRNEAAVFTLVELWLEHNVVNNLLTEDEAMDVFDKYFAPALRFSFMDVNFIGNVVLGSRYVRATTKIDIARTRIVDPPYGHHGGTTNRSIPEEISMMQSIPVPGSKAVAIVHGYIIYVSARRPTAQRLEVGWHPT